MRIVSIHIVGKLGSYVAVDFDEVAKFNHTINSFPFTKLNYVHTTFPLYSKGLRANKYLNICQNCNILIATWTFWFVYLHLLCTAASSHGNLYLWPLVGFYYNFVNVCNRQIRSVQWCLNIQTRGIVSAVVLIRPHYATPSVFLEYSFIILYILRHQIFGYLKPVFAAALSHSNWHTLQVSQQWQHVY